MYTYFTGKCIFNGNLQKYEILNKMRYFTEDQSHLLVAYTIQCVLEWATSFIIRCIIDSNQNITFFNTFYRQIDVRTHLHKN